MKLIKTKKFVKCEWSKTFDLHAVEDVNQPVSPEYLHKEDLPFAGLEQTNQLPDTGTDTEKK